MLLKIRSGMWEMKEKTCGMWDFRTTERVGGAIQQSDKKRSQKEKKGKIVKDDNGSGTWEVG